MKTTLLLLCVLCTAAAFGQAGLGTAALSNEPVVIQMITHPGHAAPQPMALEQSLLVRSGPVSAKGERPLWEVAPAANTVPLGDVARMLRKEHAVAKKATAVWEN